MVEGFEVEDLPSVSEEEFCASPDPVFLWLQDMDRRLTLLIKTLFHEGQRNPELNAKEEAPRV